MIKVYIVEDDPMVLDVNIGFLKRLPLFQLCGSAALGAEAVKEIQELKPDLVLLDMFLPDLSGMEVMKSIRERNIPTDVIMITAARDAQTIHDFFRLGAVDYLVKPFRFDRFKSALEAYEKMWNKLNASPNLKQEDIDEFKQMQGQAEYLPKGLSEKTLKQILLALKEQNEPVTSESLASVMGMARVTVRRYLEYLVQSKKIRVHIQYGSVGRPSHYYFL
ncbi:response regulator [Mesobacillus jeotgali]|uniref:response regulator n=1 Tax=Mesobacillus jeotgali TaxID=129985 RepID=UPI00177E7390|nr:response regulator [Mesobacillus jeotgali]UYZ23161.1 response regulator [Mesobacillus jeotgali]